MLSVKTTLAYANNYFMRGLVVLSAQGGILYMAWELKLFLKKCVMEVRLLKLVNFSSCEVDRLQTMARRTLNMCRHL